MSKDERYHMKSIELFSGTGGLALGLHQAGFSHEALFEWDKDSCDNIKHNIANGYPGVKDWFCRINAFGAEQGVQVEHYVISSGLKEIIEGCTISGEFKEIYASEFYYDEAGKPAWPKLAVNFTAKTQFVYRINKGVLDVSDDKTLNDSMPDDSKRVPFTNMIYVGDGLSDVPCMKMMKAYGGQALAVYQESNRMGVEELLAKDRVDFIFPADYSEGTALDLTVKNIIRKMAIADQLWEENAKQVRSIGGGVLPNPVGLFSR